MMHCTYHIKHDATNKPSNVVHLPRFIAFFRPFLSLSLCCVHVCLCQEKRVVEFVGSPWQFCETLIKGDGPKHPQHLMPYTHTHTHTHTYIIR